LKDVARNLERWVSGIVARTFRQKTVDDLALWSSVPVVNALSDMYHPCQALADMQTIANTSALRVVSSSLLWVTATTWRINYIKNKNLK